ncbi:DUF305 domain-containing protein [Paenarthrobacter sp. S56]|uniref:DUF305 domain-containing protein n=1 Tax=Paenarthrobacter sp. S56 TaxID=3138179 RepID=UPI0032199643
MTAKKFLPLSAVAVAAALSLNACAGGAPGSSGSPMPGMDHGGMNTAPASSLPSTTGDHNNADVMFAQMMIPHHAQAVEMSDMVLRKPDVPTSVSSLAARIKAAQGPEIAKMTDWLKDWNQPTMMPGGHGMDGMMGDEDMAKLEAAQGTEAAKLFLLQMVAHHQGAVAMAKTEAAAGKNADAIQLAKDIASAQEAEIKEMQQLLGTL